jgi:hypothetical protein
VAALGGRRPGPGGLTSYAAGMLPAPGAEPARRTPPAPAFAAAVLALLSAIVPAFFGLIALAFSNGEFGDGGWLVIVVPVLLLAGLVVGAVLLLLGRSWLALALPAGALAAILLLGYVMGGWGSGAFGVFALLVPVITTVLAALPGVRSWVAARRRARRAG